MSYPRSRWIRSCIRFIYKIFTKRNETNDGSPQEEEIEEDTEENNDLIRPPVEKENGNEPLSLREVITKENLIDYARRKNYTVFDSYNKSYNLNLWGVRSDNRKAGKFDDYFIVFTIGGKKLFEIFNVTVDPSRHYLLNPIHSKGTAIIAPGQHRSVWKKGFHKNNPSHPALVQANNITVYRDFNKDEYLDFDKPEYVHKNYKSFNLIEYLDKEGKVIFRKHTGMFGINCHRASKYTIVKKIGYYSAGCVVHPNYEIYTHKFLKLIDKGISNWGNSFSFTLVTEKELRINYNKLLMKD